MRRKILIVLAVGLLVGIAGCSGAELTDDTPTPTTVGQTPTEEVTTESPTGTTISSTAETNGTLSVYNLNVGQGAAALIVGPSGETMLVDSGDWRDEGQIVIDQLERLDIDRIDYLVTSHPDADHIGGHAEIIEYLETQGDGIGAVYEPGITSTSETYQDYLNAIEQHDVTLYEAYAGDTIPFENVDAEVLAPPEGYLANEDRNENSLVLHLGHGNASFLLPGDVEAEAEAYLVEQYGSQLNSTVLIPGHHGSSSSTSVEFLGTVDPRIGVITSAYDSQYGHPHEETLERLANQEVRTYWTVTHGTVQIRSNGTAITIATQQSAPTDPLSIRDGSSIAPGSDQPLTDRMVLHLQTATSSTIVADGGTTTTEETTTTTAETSEGKLAIATIHADTAGDDRDNLNDEYIVFENTGDGTVDLSGWSVSDEADHTYTFSDGVSIEPGAQITLYTGGGSDTTTEFYWGSGSPIWNNAGDTVIVENADGTIVLEESYDG